VRIGEHPAKPGGLRRCAGGGIAIARPRWDLTRAALAPTIRHTDEWRYERSFCVLTDVLILGLARTRSGITVAGMTTEPDPITGLRWVRPIKQSGPLTLDDLRYDDGALVRLGDVVQMDLGESRPQPPHVENIAATFGEQPLAFIRDLTDARRAQFFPKHIDPDPAAVLVRRERSVCLVRPDEIEAIFSYDEELDRFEARIIPRIGRLYSEDGVPVADMYWRVWGRQQLGDKEFEQIDDAGLRALLGDIYLTIGLGPRGGPLILGVHTVPAYQVDLE
jgi:hypothetical protein